MICIEYHGHQRFILNQRSGRAQRWRVVWLLAFFQQAEGVLYQVLCLFKNDVVMELRWVEV